MIGEEIQWYINQLTHTARSANTISSYQGDLNHLMHFCNLYGLTELEQLDGETLTKFFEELQQEGKSTATIQRMYSTLCGFFKAERRFGKIKNNPVLDVDLTDILSRQPITVDMNREWVDITAEQVDRLVSTRTGSDEFQQLRNRAMLMLISYTGIRTSEMSELKVGSVDFLTGYMTCGKGKKRREISLGYNTLCALRDYLNARIAREGKPRDEMLDESLFVGTNGKSMTRQAMWKIVSNAVESADLPKYITADSLRRSVEEHLVQCGTPSQQVADVMGNSSRLYVVSQERIDRSARSYFENA